MTRSRPVWMPAALLALTVAASADTAPGRSPVRDPQATQTPPPAKPKKTPAVKAAAPWPDSATIAKRREQAEALALFQSSVPLPITLAANFDAVNADRNATSAKTYPASLTVAGERGETLAIPVTLRTRGHLRLNPWTCAFPPLSVEFPKKETQDTLFDGQDKLDLITHCQDDAEYDQYVLKEYLAYRLYNLVTPRSLRVRLAQATYVDSRNRRKVASRYAVFIENEDDLARRLEGRALAFPHTVFNNYDGDALTMAMVFEFMIGNTDYSIWGLHNVRQVQTRSRPLYPIIWDFDGSGLVSAPYVVPDARLGIPSARVRVYRGPCRTLEAFEPTFAAFLAKEAESMELVKSLPGLRPFHREQAAQFLKQFYVMLRSKEGLKKAFVDRCNKKANTL
jgi:hypothetical protein